MPSSLTTIVVTDMCRIFPTTPKDLQIPLLLSIQVSLVNVPPPKHTLGRYTKGGNVNRAPTLTSLTHRLWGCVGEVVGSPRADRCVLRVCDELMIGEPLLVVSGLASNYFRIRALLSTPDFGLRAGHV
jgi:hypothetical protein